MPYCVGTLNPHKEEGVKLVMEMLRQVVKLHPGLNTLHIGADEVRTFVKDALDLKHSVLSQNLQGVHTW